MKKTMIACIIIFIFSGIFAPVISFDMDRTHCKTPVKDFFKQDRLLTVVMEKESSFVKDTVNKKEDAVGILQIRPVMLRHVNNILKEQGSDLCFTLQDRYDSAKSVKMWYIVQEHDNPSYDPMIAVYLWNGGVPRYKKMSHQYWLSIKNKL